MGQYWAQRALNHHHCTLKPKKLINDLCFSLDCQFSPHSSNIHKFHEAMSLACLCLYGQLGPPPGGLPEPSHGRVFGEKFHNVDVMRGDWGLLTDLSYYSGILYRYYHEISVHTAAVLLKCNLHHSRIDQFSPYRKKTSEFKFGKFATAKILRINSNQLIKTER